MSEPRFRPPHAPRFGLIAVDKPPFLTSRRVVDLVRCCVSEPRCGHAGTLDPIASGLLIITLGPATRLTPRLQSLPKTYQATFRLGARSETDDVERGFQRIRDAIPPTRQQIEDALPGFEGTIEQVPPAYSAIKVQGRRAYRIARRGENVVLAPRRVRIDTLRLIEFDYPWLRCEVVCGGGTYIRSLGRDLARAVGTEAVMADLRRTAIGPVTIGEAISIGDLPPAIARGVSIAPSRLFDQAEIEVIDDAQVAALAEGRPIELPNNGGPQERAVFDRNQRLIALCRRREPEGKWFPAVNLAPYWRSVDA